TEKIYVVAAVIRKGQCVLICQRPHHKRHGGLWEFPGGKLHSGESFADAMRRELREELSLDVVSVGEHLDVIHDIGSPFEIHFISADVKGDPIPLEHQRIAWVPVPFCAQYELAPSDREFVRRLELSEGASTDYE